MYKIFTFLFLICLNLFLFGQFSPALQEKLNTGNGPYEVIILLADKVDLNALEAEFDRNKILPGKRVQKTYRALRQKATVTQQKVIDHMKTPTLSAIYFELKKQYWLVNMMEARVDKAGLQMLGGLKEVDYVKLVGEDRVYQDPPVEEGFGNAASVPGSTEPGLEAIGAPALWNKGYSGLGQRALIFDSGIMMEHPAVGDRFLYFNKPGLEGWNGIDNYVPRDRPGNHGTHVTGTVLGLDRNTEDTIGVAFNARFMSTDPILDKPPYRKMSDYVGYYQFYFNPDGDTSTFDDVPDVINNSWGLFKLDTTLCTNYAADMAEAISTAGIALVFSAGNNGPGDVTIGRPAFINVNLVTPFATGAINGNDSTHPIASFSSRGPSICEGTGSLKIKPEAVAPGVNVRSAYGTNDYDLKSGTSMAAPHVSGAVLLLKEAFPYLTGKELLEALYFTAIDLGIAGEDNTYGNGIINLPAAFNYLVQSHTPIPPKQRIYDLVVTSMDIPESRFYCEDSMEISATIANRGDSAANGIKVKLLKGRIVIDSFSVLDTIAPGDELVVSTSIHGITGNGRQEYGIWAGWPMPVDEFDPIDNTRYARFNSRSVDNSSQMVNRYTIDSMEFKSGYFLRENPDGQETWEKMTLANDSTNQCLLFDCSTYLPKAGQNDMVYTPMYQTMDQGFTVSLRYAYATKSILFEDSLIFELSTDCGESFGTTIFAKSGTNLVTFGNVNEEPAPGDWVTFDTSITMNPSEKVIFRIRGVNDYGGKIYIDEFTINPSVQATGLTNALNASITVFPNPVQDNLVVSSKARQPIDQVSLFGVDGRMYNSWTVDGWRAELSIRELPKGIYFLRIKSAQGTTIKKLVKSGH